MSDFLQEIVWRKQREIERRIRHERGGTSIKVEPRADAAAHALTRKAGGEPRVIAEIKFASPSKGVIRARGIGEVSRIALGYERGGASAISVLADGPGFNGGVLDVRRAAGAVRRPVLFKEFVLHPVQVRCAQRVGASLVLLIVRTLDESTLNALVNYVHECGLLPVVEAADERELDIALKTDARVVGMNARNLRSFEVDRTAALRALENVPKDRIAVFMSGVSTRADVVQVSASRADALLVGEGLMRAPDPSAALQILLGT